MQNERVLFVDDDENILASYRRLLMDEINVDTALGGEAGLEKIGNGQVYAVIVSDLRMPAMDGMEFLEQVKCRAPESVRMMLSGNVDLETSIKAVNDGNVFRLLTKPCPPEALQAAIQAGVNQYRLVVSEKELLQKTLTGTIKVLTDILSMANPDSFGRTMLMRTRVREIASALKADKVWEIELAWMLSEIGYITVPPDIMVRKRSGQRLTEEEREIIARVPEVGKSLLANIPRLDSITELIAYQHKQYDGNGVPANGRRGDEIPLGGRILKVVTDLSQLIAQGLPEGIALKKMADRQGWYDPAVLEATRDNFGVAAEASPEPSAPAKEGPAPLSLRMLELCANDRLISDVRTRDNMLLVPANTILDAVHLERIRNFSRSAGVQEPILVARPGRQQKDIPA